MLGKSCSVEGRDGGSTCRRIQIFTAILYSVGALCVSHKIDYFYSSIIQVILGTSYPAVSAAFWVGSFRLPISVWSLLFICCKYSN